MTLIRMDEPQLTLTFYSCLVCGRSILWWWSSKWHCNGTQATDYVSDSAVPFPLTCDTLIKAQKCDPSLVKCWTAVVDKTDCNEKQPFLLCGCAFVCVCFFLLIASRCVGDVGLSPVGNQLGLRTLSGRKLWPVRLCAPLGLRVMRIIFRTWRLFSVLSINADVIQIKSAPVINLIFAPLLLDLHGDITPSQLLCRHL